MPRTGRPRLHPVREDYFDVELDVERAYWLGLILADGNVRLHGYWTVTLGLQASDKAHIEAWKAIIGGPPLQSIRGGDFWRLCVHSKAFCESVMRHGIFPRKTFEPSLPTARMEGDVLTSFLRGMFDGNGGFYFEAHGERRYLRATYTGPPKTVDWFVNQVGVQPPRPRVKNICAYACWSSEKDSIAIARRLYTAPGPALARKAEIAARYV